MTREQRIRELELALYQAGYIITFGTRPDDADVADIWDHPDYDTFPEWLAGPEEDGFYESAAAMRYANTGVGSVAQIVAEAAREFKSQ